MRVSWLGLITLVAGCGLFTGSEEALRLDDARALWNRVGPSDYSFEYSAECYCALGGQRILVTVDDGVMSGARLVGTETPIDAAYYSSIPTIPELFDVIQEAYLRKAYRIDARYDRTYGYPVHAAIDYDPDADDDEVGFTVTAFTSLELLGGGR